MPIERKIRAPSDYDGNRAGATAFLNDCQTYLRLNKDSYPTDEDKIIFILSYMVGGAAGPFKEALTARAFAINPTTKLEEGFGAWTDFLENVKKLFGTLNPIDDAITQMKSLRQTGTADEYVASFQSLAIKSTIQEVAVLSDYFLSGLSNGLVKNIMAVEKLPTKMSDYYALAIRLDLQWRKGLELTKSTAPRKSNMNTSPAATTSRSTNPVRLRKLTDEERVKLRKEGRCFRCREAGHISADCPQAGGQSNAGRRQIRVAASTPSSQVLQDQNPGEAQSAISRIRALYAQFTPAEKEEVVNIAEAEGF